MEATLLNSDELARRLNCSRCKVYSLVKEGLPAVRLGMGLRAEYRFEWSAVERWLRECVNANAVEEPTAGSIQDDDLFRERSICVRR